jgi:hypothetical protein
MRQPFGNIDENFRWYVVLVPPPYRAHQTLDAFWYPHLYNLKKVLTPTRYQ